MNEIKPINDTTYEVEMPSGDKVEIGDREAALGGKLVQQMTMRIKCPQALDVARKLITQAMSKGDKLLLPDLTIIPVYKE